MRQRNLGAIKHYKSGDYLAVCDLCGFTFYASELKLTYRNTRNCDRCFDTRNPQDFVKAPQGIRPPWTRPKPLIDQNNGVVTYQLAGLGVFQEMASNQGYNIPGLGIFTGID